jgi:hypothetical protein
MHERGYLRAGNGIGVNAMGLEVTEEECLPEEITFDVGVRLRSFCFWSLPLSPQPPPDTKW